MSNLYEPVDIWRMPDRLLRDSIAEMAPDGLRGCEGIVLWLGAIAERAANITHMVGLAGAGIEKRPDYLRIHPDLFNAVAAFAERMDLVLIGQIHSHPGTLVDLSLTDVRFGVTTPHYLSVVAPHYAQDPGSEWRECGVHVYEPRRGFRRMQEAELRARIAVMAETAAPLTRLGA